MPEHLRALIVILVVVGPVFWISGRALANLIPRPEASRLRNLWIGLTLLAFLAHDFWIYAGIASLVLLSPKYRRFNPLTLFLLLLFLIPAASTQIPGFGLINYLFEINHIRLLALAILLPAFVSLRHRSGVAPFGRLLPDKILFCYLLLVWALSFRGEANLTNSMRQGFYLFIDIFLPYYVASRSLQDIARFREALLGFLMAAMALAALGIMEFSRHWLLYKSLVGALGLNWGYSNYLGRDGMLRASVTTGQAIALGYVMMVAIGFYAFLKERVGNRFHRRCIGALLVLGLIAPLSRGPWVGAAALLIILALTAPHGLKRLATLGLLGCASLPLIALLPGGQRIIDLLPFIGSVEKGNVDYREQLFSKALAVIGRNPLLGASDYLQTPEMRSMTQGEGIVDIVNSYLSIALEYGLLGLGLFIVFFAAILLGIRRSLRHPAAPDESRRLGQALLATLAGTLVTIFSVSSITVIPVVYWTLAGLGVAYAQMLRVSQRAAAVPAPLPASA